MSNTPLWAVHIPGPDDLYAAPSEHAANQVAKYHNDTVVPALLKIRDSKPEAERAYFPPIEGCTANVVHWPWDDAGHAECLKDSWPEFIEELGLKPEDIATLPVDEPVVDTFTMDMFKGE